MKKVAVLSAVVLLLVPVLVFCAPDTAAKALHYITSMQDANGGWSRLQGEFPSEAEPTGWAVKVLSMTGGEAQAVDRGAAFLVADQKPDGSWNDNTGHTAFAVLGLSQAKKGGDAVAKAIVHLRGVEDAEGGFGRLGKEGPPLSVYTAVALEAFGAAGVDRGDPAVAKAAAWLRSCQTGDGGYGMTKNSSSLVPGTAWAVRALRLLGVDPQAPEVKNGVAYLLSAQAPSGGFPVSRGAPVDPEITAYALLALNGLPEARAAVAKAAGYLGAVQHEDGSFTSATPMQFNHQPRKNAQTTLFVAWALAEMK